MAEVIGVRFKNMGKVYYFDPNSEKLSADDHVVVETARGVECGEVAMANRDVADDSIVQPLKKVIRKATKDDLRRVAENELKAKNAFTQLSLIHISEPTRPFLGGFQPVSIKMAWEQGLSLNPVKISGTCGRLMCCLKYEQEAYLDLLRTTPKVNAVVSTPDGKGVVIDQNLLTGKLTVRLDKSPDAAPSVYKVKDVRVLKDGQIKLNKKEIEDFKKLDN